MYLKFLKERPRERAGALGEADGCHEGSGFQCSASGFELGFVRDETRHLRRDVPGLCGSAGFGHRGLGEIEVVD